MSGDAAPFSSTRFLAHALVGFGDASPKFRRVASSGVAAKTAMGVLHAIAQRSRRAVDEPHFDLSLLCAMCGVDPVYLYCIETLEGGSHHRRPLLSALYRARSGYLDCRSDALARRQGKKVRPAPGGEPAARTRSGDGEGWGRDRGRKLLCLDNQREVAVACAGCGSPSPTHTLGSACDWRLTNR